jgi:hypothetical protein
LPSPRATKTKPQICKVHLKEKQTKNHHWNLCRFFLFGARLPRIRIPKFEIEFRVSKKSKIEFELVKSNLQNRKMIESFYESSIIIDLFLLFQSLSWRPNNLLIYNAL